VGQLLEANELTFELMTVIPALFVLSFVIGFAYRGMTKLFRAAKPVPPFRRFKQVSLKIAMTEHLLLCTERDQREEKEDGAEGKSSVSNYSFSNLLYFAHTIND
jgi:hypothetical protein